MHQLSNCLLLDEQDADLSEINGGLELLDKLKDFIENCCALNSMYNFYRDKGSFYD